MITESSVTSPPPPPEPPLPVETIVDLYDELVTLSSDAPLRFLRSAVCGPQPVFDTMFYVSVVWSARTYLPSEFFSVSFVPGQAPQSAVLVPVHT